MRLKLFSLLFVCLYLVVFSEKGGRGCWEWPEFCPLLQVVRFSKSWRSDRFRNFVFQVNQLMFFFFCSIFKEINDVLLTCAKIELQVSAASVLYELKCVLRTY